MDFNIYQNLIKSRKFDELVNYLESIRDENKENWNYFYLYGFAFRNIENYKQAIDYYNLALDVMDYESKDININLCTIKHNLGIACQLKKDYENSIQAFNEAIKHDEYYILIKNFIKDYREFREKNINKIL